METKVNNAGLICSRDQRFKEGKNISPGPAAYSVSDTISVLEILATTSTEPAYTRHLSCYYS